MYCYICGITSLIVIVSLSLYSIIHFFQHAFAGISISMTMYVVGLNK